MKNPNSVLRSLQILTALGVAAIVFFLLTLFDVLPFASVIPPNPQVQSKQKIARPQAAKPPKTTNGNPLPPGEGLGDIALTEKNYENARRNFEAVLLQNPKNQLLRMKLIKSLLGLRKILEANIELEKIQLVTQESLAYQGYIAAFFNDQARAKEILTRVLTEGSNETLKANAQKILDNLRDFELARDAKIEFLQALLAQTFNQVGEYGLAIEMAFDALKSEHNYRDVWIVLGHSFLSDHKWLEAEDALTESIKLDARHPSAYFFRALTRQKQKRLPESISDFQKALEFGYKPRILAEQFLADSFFELKDFERAYPLYKNTVLADPSSLQNFIRPMALAINHIKKPLEALDLAKKALETHPNTAMAENLFGWALSGTGDYASAKEHLKTALILDPKLDAAYLNLGQLAEKEGRADSAQEYYDKARILAQEQNHKSIEETAASRYTLITARIENGEIPAPAENSPQMESVRFIPSLSLQ